LIGRVANDRARGFDLHASSNDRSVAPAELSEYVVDMVRRRPPAMAPVVAGSTPVVAFGDPSRAEVATLGINPSANEFLERGQLLSGARRRLATLESIGADRLDQLTDAQVAEVMSDCATYFQRRPYDRWFGPLDRLFTVGADVSYYDGSACHLDLVQWATQPIWGRITDPDVQTVLLEDGVPHLRAQLARENVRLVLVNGRQVLKQVVAVGLVKLEEVGRLPLGTSNCALYVGTEGGIRWVGWSTNLQSSFGVSTAFKQQLGEWLASVCALQPASLSPLSPMTPATSDAAGHLPQGLRLSGKRELRDTLQRWLSQSSAETIGDVGGFGGRAWLAADINGFEVVLNADTKRAAVERFVHASASEPDRSWRVVANRRGRINKVLPDPKGSPLPGWYSYLTQPADEEQAI
jgi:hypothetical protein